MWQLFLRGCRKEIILVRNLWQKSEDQSRVPVQFLVHQGTGETISAYHVGLQPHDSDCNPAVDPNNYLRKGFLEFCCNELTQICEYN